MQYGDFASVYDKFMDGGQYRIMFNSILSIWRQYGHNPGLTLDLACGTGTLTTMLSKTGYEMIGVDISPEMLSIAKNKAEENALDILYLQQDMRELELYGTVDSVICMCDSVNYLLEESDLLTVFRLVRNYLNPGGVFIFDMNTEYYFEKILANNSFSEVTEDAAFIWDNTYDRGSKVNCFDVIFFASSENGLYRRFDESHFERAYTQETICALLKSSGFTGVKCFDFDKLASVRKNSRKILYAAN